MFKKSAIYWTIAVVITLSAAVYQRRTGPTYPARFAIALGGHEYRLKLARSHGGTSDCIIKLDIPDQEVTADLYFRRYPGNEEYQKVPFENNSGTLLARLPNQPPAGKLQYHIIIHKGDEAIEIGMEKPVIIRFKGDVPAFILIPHILFMFFAMLLSNLAGALAVGKMPSFRKYTIFTFWALLIGGMILGPIVQKYAFGELWTGVPFGFDLTDNKTLIAFVFFLLAYIGNLKTERRYLTIIASLVLLAVYSIPHSMFGSELNYASGKVIQGMVQAFFPL
jgi:hypothetical protein